MEEHDSIDIRSKAFQEVLSEPPSWLLRWGITSVLIGFIALFLVGYFLEAPETISAPVLLVTKNPPIEIGATTLGNLINIFPEDSIVEKGTILAKIDEVNTGDFSTILALNDAVSKYKKNDKILPDLADFEGKDIGLLSTDLLQYLNIYRGNGVSPNLLKTQAIENYDRDIQLILEEIKANNNRIIKKEIELASIPNLREKYQNEYGKKTKNEQDKDYDAYVNLQRQLGVEENQLITDIQFIKDQNTRKQREINGIKLDKGNLQTNIIGTQNARRQNLELSFVNLKEKLQNWTIKHLVKAPKKGRLVYQGKLKSKEYLVDKGDKIFAIIPPGAENDIEGKLSLPSKSSIKVQLGQTVKIQFNAYRASEYGLLEGKVTDKSTLPQNGQYLVTVSLPKGMETSKLREIPFEHQMQGEAQIITADRRFTSLVFDEFKEMLRQ